MTRFDNRQCAAMSGCLYGAVLFEVVVALVIFATTAGLTLSAASNVLENLDRNRKRAQAADIASSLMNELEAGLISIEDLRGDPSAAVGTFREQARDDFDQQAQSSPQWQIDASTERSEFEGLTLVTITVAEDLSDASGASSVANVTQNNEVSQSSARFTLRQLMRLREQSAEPYEQDEMLEDLPPASSSPPPSNAPGMNGGPP